MRTIDYKGTTLTIVPTPAPTMFAFVGRVAMPCHLRGGSECSRYCPDGNRLVHPPHLLLSPQQLQEYLAAKLMGGAT